MRPIARLSYSPFLFVGLTGGAGAQTIASTFADLGHSQSTWVVAAALLILLLTSLGLHLVSRRRQNRLRERLIELEYDLARREKTEIVLKEAHEDLEARVRDRTSDLEMSYQKLNDVRDSLHAANERLDSLARVDELTGVGNRRQFDETLDIEIKRTIRARKPVSLIISEIDFFDHFRRSYGRDRADQVLYKVAKAIDNTFRRAPDVVARYDDRSFGVILPETEVRDAMRFAERLRKVVHQLCIPHTESEIADRITVSVGLATMRPDKLYPKEDLLDAASRALNSAQENGRNTVEYDAIRTASEHDEATAEVSD